MEFQKENLLADNFFTLSESLEEIKSQFFNGNDSDGFEPKCGTVSVADGTAYGIGHLFAASICQGGPGPGFLAPWIYKYITQGLQAVLNDLPATISSGSTYCDVYKEVVYLTVFFKKKSLTKLG